MIRTAFAVSGCTLSVLAAAPAFAQGAGSAVRAPKATTQSSTTRLTTPAARAKGRSGAMKPSKPRRGDQGTAGTGDTGPDARTRSGSAAPGGPGSPPPILPVPTPGSGATPPAGVSGPGDLFASVALLKA